MDILNDRWIPVVNKGEITRLSISEVQNVQVNNLGTGRFELDFSILIMLIGLKKTGFIPDSLLSGNLRFLQNKAAMEGSEKPIDQLLLGYPGANTVKNNKDFFIKRHTVKRICPCCVIPALYAKAQFSPGAGAGYYPGAMYHRVNYLLEKKTIGETITANIVDESPVDSEIYFSVPNHYWLSDSTFGECDLCGNHGAVIESFFMKSTGISPKKIKTPHNSVSKAGKNHTLGRYALMYQIVNGVAPDGDVISPIAIYENGEIGDDVIAFGTHYDKASLESCVMRRFKIREAVNKDILHKLFSLTFYCLEKRNAELDDYNSTLFATLAAAYYEMLTDKNLDMSDAAIAVFDRYYTPSLDNPVIKQLDRWVKARSELVIFSRMIRKKWRENNSVLLKNEK